MADIKRLDIEEAMREAGLALRENSKRTDADSSLILAEQLTHIESTLLEPMRPMFEARDLMSVKTEGSPWQDFFKYHQKVGNYAKAKWVDDLGDSSLPTVNASVEVIQKPVKAFALAAVWSRDEVEKIMAANANRRPGEPMINIENDFFAEVARGMADMENDVLLYGDRARNLDGFFTSMDKAIPYIVALNGSSKTAWADKTPSEILEDLHDIAWQQYIATRKVERPNVMCMSLTMKKLISKTRMSADNGETVLEAFLRTSEFFSSSEQIKALYSLEKDELTAARGFEAGSLYPSRGLAFCYNDSSMVLNAVIPMPMNRIATFLPDQANPFGFKAIWMERIGGVDIKRPQAILPFSGHEGNP